VEPETISEGSSPIAFKFRHSLEFKYAHIFKYIRTSISGEEAVEPETISERSSPIALKLWFTDCFRNLTQPSLRTGPCFRIYTTSVSGEEAVEPETISESSSPIALQL
jgi:hypothetical protein